MNFLSKYAIQTFLGILGFVILFHLCIILKIIPYDIAWGGRLKNDADMYLFETASLLINLFLGYLLLMKAGAIQHKFSDKAIQIILWIFFALFILNTLGNIFAKTSFEKSFAIITGLSALLIWSILRKK